MSGQKRKTAPEKRGRKMIGVFAAVGFLTLAAAFAITYHGRRESNDGKAGNTVSNTSSSAVVQGGNVNSITVYNGPSAPQTSPVTSPPGGHDQSPSPAPTVKQATPESSPALRSQPSVATQAPPTSRPPNGGRAASADSAAPHTVGSYAYRRCGVEYNHNGEIALSSGWSVKSLGFFARYTAAGTEERQTTSYYFFNKAAGPPDGKTEEPKKPFLMAFRVPGEDREEQDVHVYRGFKREFEADGCFYTFSVTEVEGEKISYSFRGTGPFRPVASQ